MLASFVVRLRHRPGLQFVIQVHNNGIIAVNSSLRPRALSWLFMFVHM